MSMIVEVYAKDEILKNFNSLLLQYKKDRTQFITKAAEAEKKQNEAIVKAASQTTIPNIVNGIAELQLGFNSTLNELAQKLGQETKRLQALQQAIKVEEDTLEQLRRIKISAEAFDILKHDHQNVLATLTENHEKSLENLVKEQEATKTQWHKQAQVVLDEQSTYQASLIKVRTLKIDEYKYDQVRKLKLALDKFDTSKSTLEYQLKEQSADKDKDWNKRRKVLEKQAPQLEKSREKLTGFDDKLKDEANKAREKAIQKVHREAKVETELLEKDNAASIEVYELQIVALEKTIVENQTQIMELTQQLNATLERVQVLAANAVSKDQ